MKKLLTILGISFGTIFVLLLILPFALKGKVADIVKTEGNKMLNAQFDFKSLNISLIRNFPSATVSLEDFWLKGNDEFKNDTLVKSGELSATVNIMSLFGDEGFDISRIIVDQTDVHAIVLKDGKPNWDIMKPTEQAEEEETEEASPIRIKLQDLTINELSIVYDDQQTGMFAEIKDFGGNCSGDFGSERTLLNLKVTAPTLTYSMNGVPFLSKVQVNADMDIDADFTNGIYTLKDNTIGLNAIRANVDGWVKTLANNEMEMDLKLNTNEIGFKEILSLIPAIYSKDFEGLKTSGNATFTAFAKGKLSGDSIVPQFDAKLSVKDASFRYPSMPGGVDRINIEATVKNPGKRLDETTVSIQPFNFVLAGHPFNMTATVKNPISDLDFKASANGKLNLGKVKEVYPLENTTMNGEIDANLNLSGRFSDIEKERFDRIKAEGNIQLAKMKLVLDDMPPIDIQKSLFSFSPRYLKLSETRINIGQNDLTVDSQFENYLAFAFKGTTLKGNLNISSNHLNLNDFMSTDSTEVAQETETAVDTTATKGVLRIPANIDFRMQTKLNEVLLDKMKFNHINGLLIIKDRTVDMKNLSLETMGGSVVTNGSYATPENENPTIKGSFALNEISFAQAYHELDVVKQLAPIFNGLKGNFSGKIQVDAPLDNAMNVNTQALQGNGSLSTKDLSLSGVKFIDQVADIVKKPELKNIKADNLNLDFVIADGRVTTDPFDLRLGDYNMNLSGSTGLDQTIDYKGKITLPADIGGKVRLSTVDMNIKGTFSSPKVSIDMASLAKNVVGQIFDSLGKSGNKEGNTDDKVETKEEKGKNFLKNTLNLFKKKK